MGYNVELRDVRRDDLAAFFVHQNESCARRMAAFPSEDPSDQVAFTIVIEEYILTLE